MPYDMFPNVDRMRDISCPSLIIHSIKDEIVPFYHGKELYKLSRQPFEPLFVDGTTHNNLDKISEDVFLHINKFLHFVDSSYLVNI
jgi:abhydrolase domain-containing protein 17